MRSLSMPLWVYLLHYIANRLEISDSASNRGKSNQIPISWARLMARVICIAPSRSTAKDPRVNPFQSSIANPLQLSTIQYSQPT